MDYIEQLLDKLRDLAQRLIDVLLGPEAEPEREVVPIPVDDRRSRHYR